MNLLAVDTATTSCAVAILKDGHLLAETVYTAGKTHSRHLMSLIDRALTQCGMGVDAIGTIAVTRGPGTFTGLRIGLSTVKGLAGATGARVVGVNSLAALALPLGPTARPVVAMVDARRGEVYHARFRCDGAIPQQENPVAVDRPEKVSDMLPDDALIVGSGAVLYRDLFAARSPVRFAGALQHTIRAASVGLLGQAALDGADGPEAFSAAALVPDYIRKSDAQIHMSGIC